MTLWSETPTVYKLGIIGIIVSFVFFVVGFGTPVWYQIGHSGISIFEQGLWQYCYGKTSMSNCVYFDWSQAISYSIVRAIELLAGVLHLSAVLNALFKQSCSSSRPTGIIVLGILAGIIGLVGEAIYGTWGIAGQILSSQSGITNSHLSWSFALAVIGSGMAIICAIMVAVGSRNPSQFGQVISHSGQPMQELPHHQAAPYQTQYQPQAQQYYYQGNQPMQELPNYQPAPQPQYKPDIKSQQY